MQVRVRLFSHLRLALGRRTLDLDLPEGAKVATAIERVRSMADSDLESMIVDRERAGYRLVVMVNGRHASPERHLQEGDVLSLLSPISGG